MKIIIETNPDLNNAEEIVFKQFKEWCDMSFQKYKLQIENTDLKTEK